MSKGCENGLKLKWWLLSNLGELTDAVINAQHKITDYVNKTRYIPDFNIVIIYNYFLWDGQDQGFLWGSLLPIR